MKYFGEFFEEVVNNGGMCPNLSPEVESSFDDDGANLLIQWKCSKMDGVCDSILCPLCETLTDPAKEKNEKLEKQILKLKELLDENS